MSLVRDSGGGDGGAVRLISKETNNQPAVFIDAASAQAYFQANAGDAAKLLSGRYATGIGPIAEAYPSDDNAYYVYNVATAQYEIALGLQGPEGEPGPAGSTPNVLIDNINQAAHGFTQADADAGLAVRVDNAGVWVRADNASEDTAATALLTAVIDINNFTVVFAGLGVRAGHGNPLGLYYLGSNGSVTQIKPLTGFVQEIGKVISVDDTIVNIGQPVDSSTFEAPIAKQLTTDGTGQFI